MKTIYPYREIFKQSLLELNDCPNIEIRKIAAPDGISPSKDDDESLKLMHQFSIERGIQIPEEYIQIYYVGPKLRWDWSSTEINGLSGIFHLYHISTALSGGFNHPDINAVTGQNRFVFAKEAPAIFVNFGEELWHTISEDQQQFLNSVRYIDANQQLGLYTCLRQAINNDAKTLNYDYNELWLVNEQGFKKHKLDIDFTSYFDLLSITKGAYFWQYLFIKNSVEVVDEYIMKHLLLMLVYFPIIFPENDYSVLYARFNQTLLSLARTFCKEEHQNTELRDLLYQYENKE